MKILQVNNFHYLHGGADKVYLETAKLLTEKGHTVQFLSTNNSKNIPTEYEKYFVSDIDYYKKSSLPEKIDGIKRFIFNKTAAINLHSLLKDQKPDIAHLHVFQGRLSCSILPVLKQHKVPTVFSIHEYKVLCPVYTLLDNKGEVCEACKGKHFYNCALKKCNRNNVPLSILSTLEAYFRTYRYPISEFGDHFIMVSDFVYKKHIQHRPELASKASKLYNFSSFNSTPKTPVIGSYFLYFGRLVPEKGIFTMLKAFTEMPGLILKIIGAGPLENEIKEFILTNRSKNIEMLGYKSGGELNDLISNARFTIVPSEWYESFGLIIIESMVLGTPVIGANIGAIPELVRHGENGYLFEPKNITDLMAQIKTAHEIPSESYHLLAQNAQRFAMTNFSKEEYYKQLITIYTNSIRAHNEKY